MIDPKELMLSNLVMYEGEEVRITEILRDYFEVTLKNAGLRLIKHENVQPIPLTPSILERYGFKKALNDDDIYYTEKDIFNGLFSNSWNHYDINKKAFMTAYFSDELKCEHLHHLQNIIHNLTGKPLIK